MSNSVDFERLFAHRGGANVAFKKLTLFAAVKISQHSKGIGGGHEAVAQLAPEEVVGHAVERALTTPEIWEDGEALYLKLRDHIDNYVRGLAKSKKEDRIVRDAGLSQVEEDDSDAKREPEDVRAESPSRQATLSDDRAYAEKILHQVRDRPKATPQEKQMIDHLLEGWRDRPDMCDLMSIDGETYDKLLKRIARAAQKAANDDEIERKKIHEQRRQTR